MRKVVAMDATGLNALENLQQKLHAKGKHLVLSAPHTQPLLTMQRAGFIDRIGQDNVCPHIDAALDRARQILGLPPAVSADPLHAQKQELELARQEITLALQRANQALNLPAANPAAELRAQRQTVAKTS